MKQTVFEMLEVVFAAVVFLTALAIALGAIVYRAAGMGF